MKKRRNKFKQKRVTLCALLVRAMAVVLVLTAGFAVGFQAWLKNYIDGECWEWAENRAGLLQRVIRELEYEYAEEGTERLMQIIRWKLAWDGRAFGVEMPDRKDELYNTQGIGSALFPECANCTVLADEEGSIVATDRMLLQMILVFRDDDPNLQTPIHWGDYLKELYLCDPEQLKLPEVEQFFQQYSKFSGPEGDIVGYVGVELTSIYVNRAKHNFIPHRGVLKRNTMKRSKYLYDSVSNDKKWEETEYPVVINVDLPGYELVTLHKGVSGFELNMDDETGEMVLADREQYLSQVEYPYVGLGMDEYCWGGPEAALTEFERDQSFSTPLNENDRYNNSISRRYHRLEDGRAVFLVNGGVEIGGEWYSFHVRCMLDYKNELVVRYGCKWIALFVAALTLLALIWCLRRNYRNKLRYAMEDYQRALTDNLAHDVKTPLMAISGYAENVLNGKLTEEEKTEYLHAILDNVSYSDSLVSRTLQLNHMGEAKHAKPEQITLEEIAAELLRKYEPLLAEKQITHSVEGSAAAEAGPAAMETILENLISNAVKYTPKGGNIRIEIDKKTLTVTNSVAHRLDVKKLKEPFVRGDAARSNVKGNGLGLAIADRAAKANGFKLNLNCTDSKFIAELKM